MRKGIDGLATLVQDVYELDPYEDAISCSLGDPKTAINACILMETETNHYHPDNIIFDCCQHQMTQIGSTLACEEAAFIPANMMKVKHIEHAYECKNCKGDTLQSAKIKRGKAPKSAIQRSLAGPTVLAKVIYDKFVQYLPLYRQVKEWDRYGLQTNENNLSNWVIRPSTDWLLPVYEYMKAGLMAKIHFTCRRNVCPNH